MCDNFNAFWVNLQLRKPKCHIGSEKSFGGPRNVRNFAVVPSHCKTFSFLFFKEGPVLNRILYKRPTNFLLNHQVDVVFQLTPSFLTVDGPTVNKTAGLNREKLVVLKSHDHSTKYTSLPININSLLFFFFLHVFYCALDTEFLCSFHGSQNP